jgi:hypothetical protein
MRTAPNHAETLYLRIHRSDIAFLKFLFESYEGLASVTTIDKTGALVAVNIAPGCRQDAEAVLRDLESDVYVERVDRHGASVLSATARPST